jgi:hypothetical protein
MFNDFGTIVLEIIFLAGAISGYGYAKSQS